MRCTVLLFLPLAVGCFPGEGKVDVFTEEEFEVIKQFGPLPPAPPMPTNKYADDPDAAVFGQRLFFEKGYAKKLTIPGSGLGNVGETGKVSCASCHDPKAFWSDARSRPAQTSLGVNWTSRNSPPLVNVAYYEWGSWGGKDDSRWIQAANGSESSQNFASNRLYYAHLIYTKYKADYEAIFPPLPPELDLTHPEAARFPLDGKPKSSGAADGAWELMTDADRGAIELIMANTGKAIEAYERLLVSGNAPIDRYIAGDHDALSPAAKRGLALFIGKAACVDCHSGATMTDQGFHNTGVPQLLGATAVKEDEGQYDDVQRLIRNKFNGASKYSDDPAYGMAKLAGIEPVDEMKGRFRTKSLRHVAQTGPYMHNGAYETLAEVVHFYNVGGGEAGYAGVKHPAMVPLYLTAREEADLVEFLEHLTGEPVADALGADTADPTPFAPVVPPAP